MLFRSLANVIERALILGDDEWIDLDQLPEEIAQSATGTFGHAAAAPCSQRNEPFPNWEGQTWDQARNKLLEHYEALYLQQVLAHAHGRVKDAATLAGRTPRALHYKMKRHGIRKEQFRLAPSGSVKEPVPDAPNAGS